jgi:serpin B
MAKALHFGLPQDKLHPAFNALDLGLAGRGKDENGQAREGFMLVTANSLWGQKGHEFLPQFLDLLAENYGASMRLVDYKNDAEGARKAINDWVSKQTQEKIADLIPQGLLDEATRLVLTNAIYFKDKWASPFEKENTNAGPFTLLDGSQITTEMMAQSALFSYAQGKGYQGVELPYRGKELSMVILLPDKGLFKQFENALTAEKAKGIIGQLKSKTIDLTLPKFKYDVSWSLKDTLSALGMPLAFGEGHADFSGMDGSKLLFISAVLHKAVIAVDEEGTEAAAATAVLMKESGMRISENPKMVIDRPFIFLIRDTKTGAILFLGRVLNPKA